MPEPSEKASAVPAEWTLDVGPEVGVGDAASLTESYQAVLERRPETEPVPEPTARAGRPARIVEQPPPLSELVEALLFLGGAPLHEVQAGTTLRGLTAEQLLNVIEALNHRYRQQGRPYSIQKREHGYVLVLRPKYQAVREKLLGETLREARLSTFALEVLSLVAYRQPVTRQEVEALRGADSVTLLRQLVRLGLIAVVAKPDAEAGSVHYGTTPRFLQLFQLHGLEDLPLTQELQKM